MYINSNDGWIRFGFAATAIVALGAGCPPDPEPKPAAEPDATGTWVGACDVADSVGTELDRIDVVLTLTEDADHAISGTFDYTQFYTTTTSTYSELLGVEGAREGDAVTLELQYDTTTTTSTRLVLHLTLDADTLDGTLVYEPANGYPDYSCAFDR